MKETKRKKSQKNKGITLIALVVTVVVLLILAAITLNLVLGENGIIDKAKDAKEKTKTASEDELSWMDQLEREMDLTTGVTVEEVTDENPGELAGTGTEQNPYLIQSIEDLIKFSQEVNEGNSFENEFVKLEKNLDFNSDKSYVNPNNIELFGDYNDDGTIAGIKEEVTNKQGRGFIPIGKEVTGGSSYSGFTGNFFEGNFDGNNKTIANVYINKEKAEGTEETEKTILAGFFGGNRGNIKRICVIGDINITVDNSQLERIVGGIVAYNGGNIESCYSGVNINQETTIICSDNNHSGETGGIVGLSYAGDILNCSNSGNIQLINLDGCVGGIIGEMDMETIGTVKGCNNKGNITIKREQGKVWDYVGGVLGLTSNETNISECSNHGNLYDSSYYGGPEIGGIVGYFETGEIRSCYNFGEISTFAGWVYAGGILGDTYGGGTIIDCYNSGTIKGTTNYIDSTCSLYIAGISGYTDELTIKNCYNLGDIIVDKMDNGNMIGGFACDVMDSNIENCYNYGDIIIKDIINFQGNTYSTYIGGFCPSLWRYRNNKELL